MLISVPEIKIAGAPGISVCVPTRYSEALLAVTYWPFTYIVGRELIKGVVALSAACSCGAKVNDIPAKV